MNKKYNLKLDLQFRCNNSTMKFNQFDNNTSDFFMRITNGGNLVDIEKAIVVLAIIKPSGKVASQFIEVENGLVYADLKPSMIDEIGTYTAQAMLILEDERVVTDSISYEVEEDKIFSLLNDSAETSEEFTLLTDMLSRLSTIETNEEQRVINEAERILSEENRKIEEAKRVEAELIRQHEEADRAKYDATRESNENIRKINEEARISSENVRLENEANRIEQEANRVKAEQLRKDNYNFMTEDEERRRLEANAHKEAEGLRVQAETNRVNEEAKRRTTEQARVSAENTRVSNENTRKANEGTRQTNETQRVEAETQRQNRYNSFILDAEANANNFENYTNTAKVKEEERKSNELDRKSQETKRVSNEVERISNENTRKANEKAREKNETSRQNIFENKVNEVDEKIVELDTTKDNFISSINTKVNNKISEIDNAKDNFVSNINTKVDTKISEIEVAKSDMTNTVSNKLNDVDEKIIEINATKDDFVSSVNTKVDSKISELDNTKSDMATSINNKVNEVENRFNALTSKQQQDAEVIDARDGETSLKARLDRDIEKAKQVYVDVEGSHISSDSSVGYAKDVEILGNTVQSASNLADIRSVGDKVEGQELYEIPVLSCGKNLFDGKLKFGEISDSTGQEISSTVNTISCEYTKVPNGSSIGVKGFDATSSYAMILEYDSSYNFIQKLPISATGINNIKTLNPKTNYIKFKYQGNQSNLKISVFLNETVATPYEPYVEDKLTILSPVQLEKGDILKEVDGVWGVDKNIVDTIITGDESNTSLFTCNDGVKKYFGFVKPGNIYNIKNGIQYYHITNKLKNGNAYNGEDNVFWLFFDGSNTQLRIRLDDSYTTKEQYIEWLKSNNILVKYITTQPQFIPLPHDQQVKLRTFAGKTNISFLTEIEGTIKAQVPKSLGATVNTHTEQINNLNKELDRVKKLEESTVSTVTTESDFTTVEATSNGYFEDVKLEGKTLVNYISNFNNWSNMGSTTVSEDGASMTINATSWNKGRQISKSLPSGEYIFSINNPNNATIIVQNKTNAKTLLMGNNIDMNIKFSLLEVSEILITCKNTSETGTYVVNNPILTTDKNVNGYFEGLKSVCQSATTSEDGVEEISVESVNENLFNGEFVVGSITDATGVDNNSTTAYRSKNYIKVDSNETYYYGFDINQTFTSPNVYCYDENKNFISKISNVSNLNKFTTPTNCKYVKVRIFDISNFKDVSVTNAFISKKDYYTPHQTDKKRLLYYNTETQTWEKPILRQWDSIEKHTNGKYYYHVRSIEEDYVEGDESVSNYITDMTTTVKPLSQEKVYECTNIDLITYANETNFIIESGVLSPKTTLKVHSNISNVVSLLQKKVSLLESNMTKYMITQNRLMLASRYNADTVSFKVDVASFSDTFEYDNDLYELILNNILVGKDNYNREYIENLIRFYWMDFIISDEMYSTLFEIIKEQHNPKIEEEEETPLI